MLRSAALLCLLLPLLVGPGCRKDAPPAPPSASPTMHEVAARALQEEGADFCEENAYTHCARLCAMGPRPSGSRGFAQQTDYLRRTLEAYGWTCAEDAWQQGKLPMRNLFAAYGAPPLAWKEGRCRVLLSCHVDTKSGIPGFIGADDGASAAAVLLELARVLPRLGYEPGEVVLVFFDGEESIAPRMTEEDGLYGSKRLAAQLEEQLPTDSPQLVQINLDMVGGRNNPIAIPIWDTSETMYTHYLMARDAAGLPEDLFSTHPGGYLDDHRPLLDSGVADTLNLIGSFTDSSWWHTAADDFTRISPRSLGRCGRLTLHLLRRLLPTR